MILHIKNGYLYKESVVFYVAAAVAVVVVTAVVAAVVQFDASQPCERITRTRVYFKDGRSNIFSRKSQP